MIIVEFMANGNLKDFLMDNRTTSSGDLSGEDTGSLTPQQLVMFACQVARGMNYISQMEVGIYFLFNYIRLWRIRRLAEVYQKNDVQNIAGPCPHDVT